MGITENYLKGVPLWEALKDKIKNILKKVPTRLVEQADTQVLETCDHHGRIGSNPVSGT